MGKNFLGLDGLKHFWTKAKAWIINRITTEVTAKIAEIVANAPEDLDTLKEIADWISSHANDAAAMNTAILANTEAISGKADKIHTHTKSEITDFDHTHDDRYYTESEIDTKLSGKSDTGHTHTKSEITDFDALPVYSGNLNDLHSSGFAKYRATYSDLTNAPAIPYTPQICYIDVWSDTVNTYQMIRIVGITYSPDADYGNTYIRSSHYTGSEYVWSAWRELATSADLADKQDFRIFKSLEEFNEKKGTSLTVVSGVDNMKDIANAMSDGEMLIIITKCKLGSEVYFGLTTDTGWTKMFTFVKSNGLCDVECRTTFPLTLKRVLNSDGVVGDWQELATTNSTLKTIQLSGSVDCNTLTEPGLYTASAGAVSALTNIPANIGSAVQLAGGFSILVTKTNVDSVYYGMQMFIPYGSDVPFIRKSYYLNGQYWTPWEQLATMDNFGTTQIIGFKTNLLNQCYGYYTIGNNKVSVHMKFVLSGALGDWEGLTNVNLPAPSSAVTKNANGKTGASNSVYISTEGLMQQGGGGGMSAGTYEFDFEYTTA